MGYESAPLLVVLLLVLPTVASPAATPAPHPEEATAPLDTGYEKVGGVALDGTEYEVYRYDNALPYASGYEFFGDGRVEDAETARRVARGYAWKDAVRHEVDASDVRRLRRVGETAEQAGVLVSAPLRAANTTLRAFEAVRSNETAAGRSLRGLAFSAVPALESVETTVRESRDALLRWEESVGNASEDVVRLADAVEKVRSGTAEGGVYADTPKLAADAETGLGDAVEASSAVAEALGGAANRTRSAADAVGDVRLVGGVLAPPLRRTADSLRNATEAVEGFEGNASDARATVVALRDRGTATEESARRGWRARRTAEERVYGTATVALGLVGAALLYALRRVRG